jgi:hypothetical protein
MTGGLQAPCGANRLCLWACKRGGRVPVCVCGGGGRPVASRRPYLLKVTTAGAAATSLPASPGAGWGQVYLIRCSAMRALHGCYTSVSLWYHMLCAVLCAVDHQAAQLVAHLCTCV